MKISTSCTWGGIFLAKACDSLNQDFLGKARFLKMADEGWLDWRITVPIAIVVGALALRAIFKAYQTEKKIAMHIFGKRETNAAR
ncbi:MAG: hypothetical protein ABIL58_12400 [Pseudomonadota bacterium]